MGAFMVSRVLERRIHGWIVAVLLMLAVLAGPASAAEALLEPTMGTAPSSLRTDRFYGYAYDRDTARYLYTEVHHQEFDGDRWVGGRIRYYAPDGSLLGDKTLDFSRDPLIPLFKLELPKEGYSEAITAITPTTVDLQRLSRGKLRDARVSRVPGLAADSGFHRVIVDHFADLAAGNPLRFTLAVAGELDTFHIRIKKIGETRFDDQPAIRFRAELDSLLSVVTRPLTLTYASDSRHLLEYIGTSNIHDPATGTAYNVRIAYLSQPPADAPKVLPSLQ
jgi:hypothetical protein